MLLATSLFEKDRKNQSNDDCLGWGTEELFDRGLLVFDAEQVTFFGSILSAKPKLETDDCWSLNFHETNVAFMPETFLFYGA